MKKTAYISVWLILLLSCKRSSSLGPMGQMLSTLVWVKTETTRTKLLPKDVNYDEQLYVLNQHTYLVRNDSIITIRKFVGQDDDWDNNRFTFRYSDGYRQTFDLIYNAPSNLREVQVHAPYKGNYSAAADTVLSFYTNGGPAPKKYKDHEQKLQFNGG